MCLYLIFLTKFHIHRCNFANKKTNKFFFVGWHKAVHDSHSKWDSLNEKARKTLKVCELYKVFLWYLYTQLYFHKDVLMKVYNVHIFYYIYKYIGPLGPIQSVTIWPVPETWLVLHMCGNSLFCACACAKLLPLPLTPKIFTTL